MLAPIINRIIYQPGMTTANAHSMPAALSILCEEVQLIAADGVKITGWTMKAPVRVAQYAVNKASANC